MWQHGSMLKCHFGVLGSVPLLGESRTQHVLVGTAACAATG